MTIPPLENDPRYVNTHHNLQRSRWVKLIVALMVLFGTIVTAIATVAAALIGANSTKAASQPTNVRTDIIIGFQIINQALTQGKLKVPAGQSPTPPSAQEQATTVAPPPNTTEQQKPAEELNRLQAASCSSPDPKVWSVALGSVHKLVVEGGGFGYSIQLRLNNHSTLAQYLAIDGNPTVTDSLGNTAPLTSSAVGHRNWNYGGVRVEPGADVPFDLKSGKVPELGSTIDLNVPVTVISKTLDGVGKGDEKFALSCTNLPVTGAASAASTP